MFKELTKDVLVSELKPIADWPGEIDYSRGAREFLVYDLNEYGENAYVFLHTFMRRYNDGDIEDVETIKARFHDLQDEMQYIARSMGISISCLFYFFLWAKDYVNGLVRCETDKSASDEYDELIAEMEKLNFCHPAKRMIKKVPFYDSHNEILFRPTDQFVVRENKHKYEFKDGKGGELVFQVGKNNLLKITNPNTLHAILCALNSYKQSEQINSDFKILDKSTKLDQREMIYRFYQFANSFLTWYRSKYNVSKPAGGLEHVIQCMAWVTCLPVDSSWAEPYSRSSKRPLKNIISQFGRKSTKKSLFVLQSNVY